jgi:SH3-like domain-containing protein
MRLVKRQPTHATRGLREAIALLAGTGACLSLCACATVDRWLGRDDAVFRRAEAERVEYLEREMERLRADLHQAEETMIWIESGLRGVHTRADAVSAVAEARVALEKARARAPWCAAECDEAQTKLEEADRQLKEGRLGTAVFFASRARRTAEDVLGEAGRVERAEDAIFVRGRRVNLRAGPSTEAAIVGVLTESTPVFEERRNGAWVLVRTRAGQVGWVYGDLLRRR